MGLFDKLFGTSPERELENLENKLRENPQEADYVQLANLYKTRGEVRKAESLITSAETRFPNSTDIRKLIQEQQIAQAERKVSRLRSQIDSYPNGMLYARLAEAYRENKDLPNVEATCKDGLANFPEYGGLYFVLGELYQEQGKLEEALLYLQRSIDLDKFNYNALKLKAEICLERNDVKTATECMNAILFFAPGDELITKMLKEVGESSTASTTTIIPDKSTADTVVSVMPPPVSTVSMPPLPKKPSSSDDNLLENAISELGKLTGVNAALLSDTYGLTIAGDTGIIDEALLGAMITSICRSATSACEEFSLGIIQHGIIETQTSQLHIICFGDMILSIATDAGVKQGLLERRIRSFCETVQQIEGI